MPLLQRGILKGCVSNAFKKKLSIFWGKCFITNIADSNFLKFFLNPSSLLIFPNYIFQECRFLNELPLVYVPATAVRGLGPAFPSSSCCCDCALPVVNKTIRPTFKRISTNTPTVRFLRQLLMTLDLFIAGCATQTHCCSSSQTDL